MSKMPDSGFKALITKLKEERAQKTVIESPDRGYEFPEDMPDRVWHNYWDKQYTVSVKPLFHFPHP